MGGWLTPCRYATWEDFLFWLGSDRKTARRINDGHRLVYRADSSAVKILKAGTATDGRHGLHLPEFGCSLTGPACVNRPSCGTAPLERDRGEIVIC